MNIRNTILSSPAGGIAVAPDRYDDVLGKALADASADAPVLVALSEPGSANYVFDQQAFRDERMGELAGALGKIANAALREWSPAAADVVEGFVYVLGAHETVAKAMSDGRVTAGEVIEISNVALEGALLIRERTEPFVPPGRDGGLRGEQARPATGLDTSKQAIGILAKTRGTYLGLAPKEPTILRTEPRVLAELATSIGSAVPLLGAALTALDVLTDADFHRALPVEPATDTFGTTSPLWQTFGPDGAYTLLQHQTSRAGQTPKADPNDNVLRSTRENMPEDGDER